MFFVVPPICVFEVLGTFAISFDKVYKNRFENQKFRVTSCWGLQIFDLASFFFSGSFRDGFNF